MNADKIIAAIARMRDRDDLKRIIDAAEARDAHLGNIESARRSKLIFGAYETLKKGDQVFLHVEPEHGAHRDLWGQPLTVMAVQPKNRALKVRYTASMVGGRGIGATATRHTVLRWRVLDRLSVSTEPTPEALEFVLKGGES